MNERIKNQLFSDLLENDKIKIPSWAKKVKLDVGTSLSAPNSEIWLERESDLVVFGFEPNINNVRILNEGQNYWKPHLKKERINHSFFCINCALSNFISEKEKFYCTGDGNPGTSSLFQPKNFQVLDVIDIPVITLESFFDIFPWDKINFIDQVKIDAQSSDFNIVKGIGHYLKEKIVYIDVETWTNNHYHSEEKPEQLKEFLLDNEFQLLKGNFYNSTFINKNLIHLSNSINYYTQEL